LIKKKKKEKKGKFFTQRVAQERYGSVKRMEKTHRGSDGEETIILMLGGVLLMYETNHMLAETHLLEGGTHK